MLLPAIAAAGQPAPVSVPLVQQIDGRIAAAVRINDSGPFWFRVDTGASRTVVSARLAAQLRLDPAGQSRTITQTGQALRVLVRIDALLLAGTDLGASSVLALVAGPQELGPASVDGLLGQDVLGQWTYTIDYLARQLRLGCSGPRRQDRAVRLALVTASTGVMAVVPQPGAKALQLVPDSGADRLVLFGAARFAGPPPTVLDIVRVRSMTGDALARLVRIDNLRVGTIRIRQHEGLVLESGPHDGRMGDGLLPLHFFARVTFNIVESFLLLEPRS